MAVRPSELNRPINIVTNTHTQTNEHTGWKNYNLAIAGDKNCMYAWWAFSYSLTLIWYKKVMVDHPGTACRIQLLHCIVSEYCLTWSKHMSRNGFGPVCVAYIHDDGIKWNHFRVTGPLWAKFTGHRWIPLTKASNAELWCFLWSAPE